MAVNRRAASSSLARGANLFVINHVKRGQKAIFARRMLAIPVFDCCERLNLQ